MLRILHTILLTSILSVLLMAQGDLNSPFSRFGIGDLNDRGFMHLRQMGGLLSSYQDNYHLNFENPASLAFLTATAFDVGLEMQYAQLEDPENMSNQWSGNLSYIGFGFPLRNPVNQLFTNERYDLNWGMGFAITPVSTISYDITTADELPEIGTFNRTFTGEGGFYKAIWGNALRYKQLSGGVNVGMLFGKDSYTRNVDFIDEIAAFDNAFTRSYTARGFYWDAGAMYNLYLNKADTENTSRYEPQYITFGLTAKSNTGFSTESDVSDINFLVATSANVIVDTLNFSSGIKGNGVMPGELGFGMTYHHKNKFAIGVDYKRVFWSNYENDANPESLDNTSRFALGGYYRPDYNSINSFFSRVYYRFGFFMEQDPRQIENKSIDNYGLNLGFGLPFSWQRKISHMNLGVSLGKRSIDDILSETYVKMTLGFTFNDSDWFIKRKYN